MIIKRNGRGKALMSFLIVFAFICTAFLSCTITASGANFTGYSEFEKGRTFAYPLYVNDNGKKIVAYCFNAKRTWPQTMNRNGNTFNEKIIDASADEFDNYSDVYVANKKDNVLKTVYYGYPYNKGKIQEKYGLTDMQFRAVTQAAIWWWTDKEDLGASGSYYGSKFNLTHITQYVYDSSGNIVYENGQAKYESIKVFDWTDGMTNAYYELRNNGSFNYPDSFQLDLYKCSDETFQNLLSTKLTEDEKPTSPDVNISKVSLGGENIAGASIEISDTDGDVVHEYVSTDDVETITLEPGTYTFHEEAAPNGYLAVSDFSFTIADDGEVTLNNVASNVAKIEDGVLVVTDQYTDQEVEISKTDVGGEELPGASMEVTGTTEDGTAIEAIKWTSGTETKKISVQPGTYTLTEKTAPDGYKKAESITFKVAVDEDGKALVTVGGQDVDGTVTMIDKYSDRSVEISKTDVGGEELPGAGMEITGQEDDGTEIVPIKWTSGTETKKISVQPGTYKLTEKTAPKGYEVAESITFKVAVNKEGKTVVTIGDEDVNGKVTMVDKYGEQSVEISKTDVGGNELAGADMEVTGTTEDGTAVEAIKWTSGTETKKISVRPGTYTLTEKTAPKGYEVAESITFKVAVDKNGNTVVTVNGKDVNGKVTMKDKYSDQAVEISKTDIGGEELPGAGMELTGKTAEGTAIEAVKWTSGETARKLNVQPGTYTLTEKTAPKGYEKAESIEFTVSIDKDGKAVVKVGNEDVNGTVTMVDKYSDQEIEISKVDIFGKEIEGAKMQVTGKTSEGKEITPIEWTSGKATRHISVQPGEYVLHEEVAPDGYEYAADIPFTVKLGKDGNPIVTVDNKNVNGRVTMEDKYSDHVIGISKVDISGEEIEGAHIIVRDGSGNVIDEWTSKKGVTHEMTVQPGVYVFHEESAPKGYKAVSDIEFSVDVHGNVTILKDRGSKVKVDPETGKLVVTDEYDEKDKKGVDTSDKGNLLLSFILMVFALIGAGGLLVYRRN